MQYYYQDIETMAYYNTLYSAEELYDFKHNFYNGMACVGASGSLFGLLVAFAMMFPNTYLNLYFFRLECEKHTL